MTVATAFCRVVEAVDELETERDQQRNPQQNIGRDRRGMNAG
jgi:hypothetical protein